MICDKCNRVMRKVERRSEFEELYDDATDGQIADYIAALERGENGEWNLGIVEYTCPKCGSILQLMFDNLPNYGHLISAWHEKAGEGDYFARFVFEYLSFIAHIKNNLFYDATSDRNAIQKLKQHTDIKQAYLNTIDGDYNLQSAWNDIIGELEITPLHNSSRDPDNPEIDVWWNNEQYTQIKDEIQPVGKVLSLSDWCNMVEYWYSVRNNLFHGGKDPNIRRDIFLVQYAYITLRPLMNMIITDLR